MVFYVWQTFSKQSKSLKIPMMKIITWRRLQHPTLPLQFNLSPRTNFGIEQFSVPTAATAYSCGGIPGRSAKTPKRSLEAKIKNKRKSRGDKTRVSTKNTWNYNWPEQLVRGRSPQTLWLPISGNAPEVDIEKCAIRSKHRQTLSIWTSKCCVSTHDTYNQSDKIKLFEPVTPQLNTWPKMGTSPL